MDENTKQAAMIAEAQKAEQARQALLRTGKIRVSPESDRKVDEKEIRLLQQAELCRFSSE